MLGLTATPERLDSRGLGDVFEVLVEGPPTAEQIKNRFLSRYSCYAPPEPPDLNSIATGAGDFASDQLAAIMAQPVIINSAVKAYEESPSASAPSCSVSTASIA